MSTIVVTGLGALTPLGNDVASTWEGLRSGRSGIGTIEQEWAADLPVRFAGQVDVDVDSQLTRIELRHMDRSSQLAVIAARQAWEDAGLTFSPENEIDPNRTASVVGTGIGGLRSTISQWEILKTKGQRRVSPFAVPMLMSNAPAANVGLRIGARAGVHTTVSACASSNEAISLALDMLRAGRADIALVGGAEALIHPLPIVSFAQMQALSKRNDEPQRASRPWDRGRDGFVMGEGSVMLVLETLEHATARGARVHGTIAGSGISADSYDMVKPDPSGRGQRAAMRKALADADLAPADINHINAVSGGEVSLFLAGPRIVNTAISFLVTFSCVFAEALQSTAPVVGRQNARQINKTLLLTGDQRGVFVNDPLTRLIGAIGSRHEFTPRYHGNNFLPGPKHPAHSSPVRR